MTEAFTMTQCTYITNADDCDDCAALPFEPDGITVPIGANALFKPIRSEMLTLRPDTKNGCPELSMHVVEIPPWATVQGGADEPPVLVIDHLPTDAVIPAEYPVTIEWRISDDNDNFTPITATNAPKWRPNALDGSGDASVVVRATSYIRLVLSSQEPQKQVALSENAPDDDGDTTCGAISTFMPASRDTHVCDIAVVGSEPTSVEDKPPLVSNDTPNYILDHD